MRIVNLTPWDTKVLRKIVLAAYGCIVGRSNVRHGEQWWWSRGVFVFLPHRGSGKIPPGKHPRGTEKDWIFRLPNPHGLSWVARTREQYNQTLSAEEILQIPHRPPSCVEVGEQVFTRLVTWHGYRNSDSEVFEPQTLRGCPVLLPLQKPKPEKPKKDPVRDRYNRVLALERKWKAKAKLAETKLKKLREKRRYYERKFKEEQ